MSPCSSTDCAKTEGRPPKFEHGIQRFDTFGKHLFNARTVLGGALLHPALQTAPRLSMNPDRLKPYKLISAVLRKCPCGATMTLNNPNPGGIADRVNTEVARASPDVLRAFIKIKTVLRIRRLKVVGHVERPNKIDTITVNNR